MEYILNTKAGMRIDFPPNKFGYNDLEARNIKRLNNDADESLWKNTIKPYPHLKFRGSQAVVVDRQSIEEAFKNGDDEAIDNCIQNPWTIEMIRKTKAYKDGDVWELTFDQVDQIRKMNPYPSKILPEDFHIKKNEHKNDIEFLRKHFYTPATKDITKEICDDYCLKLQAAIEKYRIVNVPLPQEHEDVKKYAKLLEASRIQIEMLFDDIEE
jgi:hypothetical protein